MAILNPTPPQRLVDARGRPYFLWDLEMDLEAFRASLHDPDPDVRAYFMGKLMRQAKPDDVFSFISLEEISTLWPRISRHLGKQVGFWTWLLDSWQVLTPVGGEA